MPRAARPPRGNYTNAISQNFARLADAAYHASDFCFDTRDRLQAGKRAIPWLILPAELPTYFAHEAIRAAQRPKGR